MLIKYQNSVINLEKVSEFVKANSKTIRFFFDSFDHNTEQITSSEYEFDSQEDRDEAFDRIISEYSICHICDLG